MGEISIENELLFQEALKGGINLFTGSGFSSLAKDKQSVNLPSGDDLKNELCLKFELPKNLSLSQTSNILKNRDKEAFYRFLEDRFDVSDASVDVYSVISQLPIKSVFTTNIDDLLVKVYQRSNNKYLHDVTTHGASIRSNDTIDYIPLHGSISNGQRDYIFTPGEIASATYNQNTWSYLRILVQKNPTLFWGYSLNDAGVLETLFGAGSPHNQLDKWILLREYDEASDMFFKSMGFKVIVADTQKLLRWLTTFVSSNTESVNRTLINDADIVFQREKIPNNTPDLPRRSLKYFFMGDEPMWFDIYSNRIPKLSYVSKVLEAILGKKHIILTGLPACGKTTIMMQAAVNSSFKGHKLICSLITRERAELIASRLLQDNALILIDNFTSDVEVISAFLTKPNVRLLLADRYYNFERVSHLIDKDKFEIIDCSELSEMDISIVSNSIPAEIKSRNDSRFKQLTDPTLFDLVSLNINQPRVEERYRTFIDRLYKENQNLLELLVMTCYVNRCGTIVSLDMANYFFDNLIDSTNDIYEMVSALGGILQDYTGPLIDNIDQDYFTPRSNIIAEAVLNQTPREIFAEVFDAFHKYVPKFSIIRYDIFKRSAYDSDFVKVAYSRWQEGRDFYERILEINDSPFIWQQGALYLGSKSKYDEAFTWIDKAQIRFHRTNFLIRNSYAIILFEANINNSNPSNIKNLLDESMDIIRDCYTNDKKKVYHCITYAKQAKRYFRIFQDAKAYEYMRVAYRWLQDEKAKNPWNREIISLIKDIEPVIQKK